MFKNVSFIFFSSSWKQNTWNYKFVKKKKLSFKKGVGVVCVMIDSQFFRIKVSFPTDSRQFDRKSEKQNW